MLWRMFCGVPLIRFRAYRCQKAHLYVWDEPLNFIDIYWRMHIEQVIEEFSPTMLFVEQTAFSKKRQQYEPL